MAIPFVLASASPARRRLLQLAGIDPFVYPSDFDEDQIQLSDPAALVQELARHKLQASLDKLWRHRGSAPGGFFGEQPGVILGCDSVLAIHGEIYGKPANPEEAIARWKKMRGQVGELYTGHALSDGYAANGTLQPQRLVLRSQVTQVYFADPSDAEIEAYVATGEPLNCAGCFAIEGKGSVFVQKIDGCHTNVIGLCMPLLRTMLAEMDLAMTDFWKD